MKAIVPFILTSCLLATDSARGDVSVSLIRAIAHTNAFAPLDQSKYYEEKVVYNTSPANAASTNDWSGPNFNGTTNTWRWIGAASINSTTTQTPNQLVVNASGSFNFDVTTTTNFINPNQSTVQYAPTIFADYLCTFSIDRPGAYILSGVIEDYFGRFSIASVTQNATIFRQDNDLGTPLQVNTSGVLPAGQYTIRATTGYGGATNMGASHWVYSGSFTNFNFTVSVPEPALLGALGFARLFLRRRR